MPRNLRDSELEAPGRDAGRPVHPVPDGGSQLRLRGHRSVGEGPRHARRAARRDALRERRAAPVAAVQAAGPHRASRRRRGLRARERLPAADAPDAGRRHRPLHRRRRLRREHARRSACCAISRSSTRATSPSAASSSPRKSCAPTASAWRKPAAPRRKAACRATTSPRCSTRSSTTCRQQVSRSLQFFLASGSGREQPEQILICGGCANIPGVADVIASRVGIPAERGDPLGQMKISSRAPRRRA